MKSDWPRCFLLFHSLLSPTTLAMQRREGHTNPDLCLCECTECVKYPLPGQPSTQRPGRWLTRKEFEAHRTHDRRQALGARALAEVIAQWGELTELGVSDSLLSSRGMVLVGEAMQKGGSKNLQTLRLQYDEIDTKGLQALLAALKAGALPSLGRVELNGNVQRLDMAISPAITIESLGCSYCVRAIETMLRSESQ